MSAPDRHDRVLAIYPHYRGIAFIVLEGAYAPCVWGIKEVRGRQKNRQCLRHVERLMAEFPPHVLVLQNMSRTGTMRARRIKKLNAEIGELAEQFGVPVYQYSGAEVRQTFAYLGLVTKRTIAEAIAKHVPALRPPRVRRPWTSEDSRMWLFDAAALAWTFFQQPQ
jgi:hypothetical protein